MLVRRGKLRGKDAADVHAEIVNKMVEPCLRKPTLANPNGTLLAATFVEGALCGRGLG